MQKEILKNYLEDIAKTFKVGDATEISYYPALKKLFENYLEFKHQKPSITVVPKKTKAGIPDFTIRKHRELVGNIEAKEIATKNLDDVHDSEQIERYRKQLPNFILTNFLDFQLFREGNVVKEVRIAQPVVLKRLRTAPPPQNEKNFFELLDLFFDYSIPELKSAKTLAQELAHRAQHLQPYIIEELTNQETDEIDRIYAAFKKYLIPDLSVQDFADIYAQTITYGLFTARLYYAKGDFSRFVAADYIPKNMHIFHDTFSLISGNALPQSIDWIVDDIAAVLKYCDIDKIRENLHCEKAGGDPIMHFYETFLAEYDPKKRKSRGVYYTPLPVVFYITRSVNILLKEKFSKKDGFADKSVMLLDPASGTLTFLAQAISLAKEEVDKGAMSGAWKQIVKNHILKNFYAFEFLMAPYIIGHLKISLLLEDLGYKISNNDRFPLYLTNTLDLRDVKQSVDPYVAALSEEAIEAKKVKEQIPILAIMGNPPYSGHSKNIGEWITNLIEDYKKVDGKPLGEKNPKWLQDDYVKFIRFGQWKIEQAGQGVLAFITNHSYLDNPTFRGMRQSLIQIFNEIYFLDLHGNYLKKEKTPEGEKDENVFDIQQGVAIAIFIKELGKKGNTIYHSDLWGLREDKYSWLENNDIKSTKWKVLRPKSEMYFFIPRDEKQEEQYNSFLKITDIFPVNSVGIVTSRDNFVFDFDEQSLKRRIETFRGKQLTDEIVKATYNLRESKRWKISKAREEIRKIEDLDKYFVQCLYRPFDIRYLFYHNSVIERSRKEVMRHTMEDNLALITNRQIRVENIQHTFVSKWPVDLHILELANASAYVFPLYLYPDEDKKDLFSDLETLKRKPNFNPDIFKAISVGYKKQTAPEDIFYYIYSILCSNIYRQKYQEFLKIDFPRIPFTKDYKIFKELADLGEELVSLHLLKSKKLDKSIAKFPAKNSCKVKKREYNKKEERIYINDKQYFSGVSKEIWNYYIGGYQVLDKWLKERQGEKALSDDDIKHFLKVITTLSHTIDLQKEIDKLYPKVEKALI